MLNLNLTRNTIIFVVVALFILLFLRECNSNSNLKQQLVAANTTATTNYNNLLAAQDTIKVYKNTAGDLVAEKRSYTFDTENFEKQYSKLSNQYSTALSLNKNLSNVNSLLKSQLTLKDTIKVSGSIATINDTTDVFKINDFKDYGNGNNRTFNGNVKFSFIKNKFSVQNSEFDIQENIKLYADIQDNNGYKSLKMSTSYPGIKFDSIENINLINNKLNEKIQKKARWSIGFGVGYGASLINGQIIQFGPTIGVGLYWSPKFLQF